MCDESAASPLIIITTPSCNVLPVYFGHFICIISVDKNLSEAWRHNHSVCHLLLPSHVTVKNPIFKILFFFIKSY